MSLSVDPLAGSLLGGWPAESGVGAGLAGLPVATVFADALRGGRARWVGASGEESALPVGRWCRHASGSDRLLLRQCLGATLDVGCGPGRMSAHLAARGQRVLGVDVSAEAVRQARERGVLALRRDVFAPLPGEGRWDSVLLADGNIGIGGDPAVLLRRAAALICPTGRIVVDLAPPGAGITQTTVALRSELGTSEPFPWATVAIDRVAEVAAAAGLSVHAEHHARSRWFAVLERA